MSFMHKSAWPIERVNKLGALLAAGYSASQAAAEMGCTRNSIVGVAHRKGLGFTLKSASGRPRQPGQKSAAPKRLTPFRPKIRRLTNQGNRLEVVETLAPVPMPAAEDLTTIPVEQRCSLLELSDSKCRWPIGDPGTAEFFFCGGVPFEGAPYCLDHCRISYRRAGQEEVAA